MEALLPRLKFRPMEEREAVNTLAEVSVAPPEYAGSVRLLMEYLEAVHLIERENRVVTLAEAEEPPPPQIVSQLQPLPPQASQPAPSIRADTLEASRTIPSP